MLDNAESPPLLHQHHTVLILRLTLDQQYQLYRGVVIDADEQVVGQFRDWQELAALLEQYWRAQSTA